MTSLASTVDRARPGASQPSGVLQRKCAACGAHTPAGATCTACAGEAEAGPGARETPNRTGLPASLKRGLEELSGFDLSDVRVHPDSARPAALDAHAFTFGHDIHLAPGQQHQLPHEAWHVVQQMQSRVAPTASVGGMAVNDDKVLEREADELGAKAEALGRRSPERAFATTLAGGDSEDDLFRTRVGPRTPTPIAQARVVQRAATFDDAGTVTSNTNLASHFISGQRALGFTPPTLNASPVMSGADARAALVKPTLGGQNNPDGTATAWVNAVGDNKGSFTMQLPSAGPWSTATTKASANTLFTSVSLAAVPACRAAGDTTFSVNGKRTDADLVAHVTTHEKLHAADHKAGFNTVIGAWDKKLEAAKTAGTKFAGASAIVAEAILYAAMGGPPNAIADQQSAEWERLNRITHRGATLATGGKATPSNPAADRTCTTSSMDVT